MASSNRFTMPTGNTQVRDPVTPDAGIRNRSGTPHQENAYGPPDLNASPTSSTVSSLSPMLEPSCSFYRPVPSQPSSALGTPRKIKIRADLALLTCFDPTDREIYDLWAPKA